MLAANPVFSQSNSTNYSIDESFIGPGGIIDASSASYSARASLGDLGIGNAVGTLYQLFAGYTTTAEEVLELNVTGATIDFGVLDSASAATGTGTFTVRSYLAQGYSVTTSGGPPTNGAGDTITAMSSAAASSPGTEQFGFNLVANTAPTTFGANPVQIPDSTFSFGAAATGYDTANQYKYTEGEEVASSASSSGVTQYTMSYIMNIDPLTEAGQYDMVHSIIATPTF